MKMSREQLKGLVKECLVELLSEGLGSVAIAQQPARPAIAGISEFRPKSAKPKFDPRLDVPVGPGRAQTPALQEAIKREAGGNPVLESIFADTARTSLPAMLAHGDPSGKGSSPSIVQKEQFEGEPEEVFGTETASRWANLAFMDAPNKKTA